MYVIELDFGIYIHRNLINPVTFEIMDMARLKTMNGKQYFERDGWCRKYCSGLWAWVDGRNILFELEEDAVAFKLCWI